MTIPDLDHLLLLAIRSSFIAGKAIMQVYGKSRLIVRIKKDFSPLTIADQAAHDVLMTYLENTQIPVISEEGLQCDYSTMSNWELFWLVDPLDGTKEFLRQNGEFTVNIALIKNNLPHMGVIYAPATGNLYYGYPGLGSYLLSTNVFKEEIPVDLAQVIRLSERLPFRKNKVRFTIVASRSHRNFETQNYLRKMKKEYGRVEIISIGSSLKFCLVAEGNADIYPRFGPTMEWDTAAGQAIATQSGCSVTRYDTGDILTYNKKDLKNPWFFVQRNDRY
jgi:3'(2'), 5'-bisphosphate nucleotidase